MKRLVGYLSISVAMLAGVLVGVVPSILSINGNSDFSSSNRYVFKISDKRLDASFDEGTNTNGGNLTYDENGETPLEQVTDVFKERLSLAGISSYKLESYDDNMFALTFKDTSDTYDDILSYLTFSNSLMLKNLDEEYNIGYDASDVYNNNTSTGTNALFVSGSANVQYRDNYPYVVVELAHPDLFKEMLDGVNASDDSGSTDATTDSSTTTDTTTSNAFNFNKVNKANTTTTDTSSDDTTEEDTKIDPKKAIFVVNNWLNGFNLQGILNNENGNINENNFSDYIITYFDVSNPSSFIWDYDSSLSTEEQEAATYSYLYFSNYDLGAINGDNGLDVETSYETYNALESSELLAYKKANLFANKINASDLKYDVTLVNQSQVNDGTNFVSPFVEYLKRAGQVQVSTVLICSIIAVVIVTLFLLLNYGLAGIMAVVASLANVVGALGFYNFLGNEFSIGTILGLFGVAAISILGSTLWLHRAKESIYQGKNLKKAYQDANKKTLLNILDFTVVSAIIGLVAYLIPNSYTSSFGGVLLIGTILSLITIGIAFRAVSWLLYNSQFAQKHIKLFGVERKLVPDLTKGEKPTYFEPFKRRSSKTTFKVTGIIAALLLVASVVGITTFQVVNGNVYNSSSNETDSKVVVSYVLRNAGDTYDMDSVEIGIQDSFDFIYNDESHTERTFGNDLNINSFYYEYVYGETSPITNREYYYVVDLGTIIDPQNLNNVNYYYFNGETSYTGSISDVITTAITNSVGNAYVVDVSASYDYNDNLINMYVAISTAIAVAAVFVYFLLRFGPSKALVALLIGGSTLTSIVGIFSLIRGPFPSEITIGLLILSLVSYLLFDVFFTNERLVYLDNKHEITDLAKREEYFDYAGNAIYNYVVINCMFIAFIILSFFFTAAFDRNTLLFILVGLFLTVIFIKALELPIQIAFNRAFEKISSRVSENRNKNKENKKGKKISYDDGPQEAIFTGIND